jgi:hypothetical protein
MANRLVLIWIPHGTPSKPINSPVCHKKEAGGLRTPPASTQPNQQLAFSSNREISGLEMIGLVVIDNGDAAVIEQ